MDPASMQTGATDVPPGSLLPKVMFFAGLAILGTGALGFLSGAVFALNDYPALDTVRLPLGAPEGLAVDAVGRIYVGSRAYQRISRFHPNGQFERSWRVPLGRGAWRFQIDSKNRLLAAIGSGERWSYYRISDAALESIEPFPWKAPHATGSTYTVQDGTTFAINPYLLSVDRALPGGAASAAVKAEPALLPMSAPFHAWLTAAVGMLLIALADAAGKKRKRRAVET